MMFRSVSRVLTFIRFSHTIFALPFALGAMFVAKRGLPSWRLCGLIVLAMAAARTAAMAFNRLADWQMDQRNLRTAGRHKLISRMGAVALCAGSAAAFVAVTMALKSGVRTGPMMLAARGVQLVIGQTFVEPSGKNPMLTFCNCWLKTTEFCRTVDAL